MGEGSSSFGDQRPGSTGMIEQVSMYCTAPSEVLVQSISLGVPEAGRVYRFELDFRERPPAPNGRKAIVVSQAVKIRVRFGQGGFNIGLNVWHGPANSSMVCTAEISGYEQQPKASRKTEQLRLAEPRSN